MIQVWRSIEAVKKNYSHFFTLQVVNKNIVRRLELQLSVQQTAL
jgi:hypothetical protein